MNWLKNRREELNLSQEELAAKLQTDGINISRAGVSAWETERNNPPFEDERFRRALAKALKLTNTELLTRAGLEDNRSSKKSREAQLAADIVERMSPDKREMALRILEAMEN